jgi:competence protein ComEA
MLTRRSIGALGAISAALGLAALAGQPARMPAAPAPISAPQPHRPEAQASTAALQALRDGRRLDLNHASAADLELLPGIGPSLARRIVEDRSAHGAFGSIDALRRVHGIGPRTIERLRALVQIEAGTQGRAAP